MSRIEKHKHHIIPKHSGGDDSITNLIEVSVEEHFYLHYKRWKEFGDINDLFACRVLGYNKNLTPEERFLISSSGGRNAQKILRKLKICSYYNEEKRNMVAQMGRDMCKENGSGFYDSELQSKLGKIGGPRNKGFVWLNDGVFSHKYTKKQQSIKSVEDFLKENPKYKIGRIKENFVVCPNCNKKGNPGAMYLHHFDNCGKKRSFKIKKIKCPHCHKIGAGGAMKRFHFNNCKEIKENNED